MYKRLTVLMAVLGALMFSRCAPQSDTEDTPTSGIQETRNAAGCPPNTKYLVAEVLNDRIGVASNWGASPHPTFPTGKYLGGVVWTVSSLQRLWFFNTRDSFSFYTDATAEEVGDWLERNSSKSTLTLTNISHPEQSFLSSGEEVWGVYWQNTLPTLSWTTSRIEMRRADGTTSTPATSRTTNTWERQSIGAYGLYRQMARLTCLDAAVLSTPRGAYASSVTASSVRVFRTSGGCWTCENL